MNNLDWIFSTFLNFNDNSEKIWYDMGRCEISHYAFLRAKSILSKKGDGLTDEESLLMNQFKTRSLRYIRIHSVAPPVESLEVLEGNDYSDIGFYKLNKFQ